MNIPKFNETFLGGVFIKVKPPFGEVYNQYTTRKVTQRLAKQAPKIKKPAQRLVSF